MDRVLTIGTFDLFHVGHVRLLKRCYEMAGARGRVIVGVNADAFVMAFKGRPPVVPEDDRREVVESCWYVDDAFIHEGRHRARADIYQWQPNIIVVGDDWKDRDYLGQLGVSPEFLEDAGVEVVYVPRTEGVSTTSLRAASR